MNLNMFKIFDPNWIYYPMNFYMLMILYLMLNFKFWKSNNFKKLFFSNNYKSSNKLFSSIKLLIMMLNLMNILPNYFNSTNNIMLTFNISFNLWMMIMIYSMLNNYNILLMNLSPKSTMLNMILIINLIELNSMLFLIISISARLMINMMMGHITIFMINNKLIIYIYLLIELMIILIQTYVYFILNMINFNNMN